MIRDQRSNALLNNDLEALNKYKKERDQQRRFEQVCRDVDDIKQKLDLILERLGIK